MEKSASARNEKVSNNIHDDLALSILSKLSLKSLNRFRCVRKSWTNLFKNPYFMSLFCKNFISRNHSYYDDAYFLQFQTMATDLEDKFVLYAVSGERFENKTIINWPNPFQEGDREFGVVGSNSINGIFCLICYSQPNNRVVLWNPTTKEYKVIPTSLRESIRYMDIEITRHGFGYVSIVDDYKVIRQVMHTPKSDNDSDIDDLSLADVCYDLFWEIYSLRSNSWKKLHFDVPFDYREEGICLDGVCHWLGEDGYDSDNDDDVYLLSFDLSKEVFLITPIPYKCDRHDFQMEWKDLVVLNGFISLISACAKTNTFHISVLGELGVKESWLKLYDVCPLPCIERPVAVRKRRYIFSKVKYDILVCIDLSTLLVEELDYVGFRFWGKTIVYKESSLSTEGINK